jgi:hypothetical protein
MPRRKQDPNSTSASGAIKVIATKTCKTLNGKSQLTYQLGRDDTGDVYLRLYDNSGGGFFDNSWVPLQKIGEVLRQADSPSGLTSFALLPLFRGKSANNSGFFAAVLRAEKALIPYKRNQQRRHALGDLDVFLKQSGKGATASKPRTKRATTPKTKTTPRRKPKAASA